MAQLVQVPAGSAKEAVKLAVVLELVQLPGLNDAGERAPAGAQDPSTSERPERTKAGLGKARLKTPQQGSEGTDQKIGHDSSSLPLIYMKDNQAKKELHRRLRTASNSWLIWEICLSCC